MLLPYTTLTYYGPGAMAAYLTGVGSVTADIKGIARAGAGLAGSGTITTADLTAGKAMAAALAGVAELTASAKGRARLDALISIGALPSATDIAQAVWGASKNINLTADTTVDVLRDASSAGNPWAEVIESGYTAAQILRLIAAAVQGNATGLESGAPAFKGLDGTTTRIDATYAAGVRVVTDRDAD